MCFSGSNFISSKAAAFLQPFARTPGRCQAVIPTELQGRESQDSSASRLIFTSGLIQRARFLCSTEVAILSQNWKGGRETVLSARNTTSVKNRSLHLIVSMDEPTFIFIFVNHGNFELRDWTPQSEHFVT